MVESAGLNAIVAAFERQEVLYLLVGDLAVVAHGHDRPAVNVEVVVLMQTSNVRRALHALGSLGYQPIDPDLAEVFTEPGLRAFWMRENHAMVLRLHSSEYPKTPVAFFVSEPFDFEEEHQRAVIGEIAPGLQARVICLATLIRMKMAADGEQDRDDARVLRQLAEKAGGAA